MQKDDLWSRVAAERTALAEDLSHLSTQDWSTPSLCAGWDVQQCLAHMTSTTHTSPAKFVGGMAKAGFNFDKFAEVGVAEHSAGSGEQTLDAFRKGITSRTAPPGPALCWLGETVIHAEDIRRPLGISHDYPAETVLPLLDFFARSNLLIGAKKRIAGLNLRTPDGSWSTGSGPVVEGEPIDLLLAMTGRRAALDRLTGEGVQTLASRVA